MVDSGSGILDCLIVYSDGRLLVNWLMEFPYFGKRLCICVCMLYASGNG